jgi:hypothetical protein
LKCYLAAFAALAAGLPAVAADPKPAKPTAAAVAALIDRHVGEKLKASNVPPAPLADDATFFRRVNLVLGGRVPVPSEVRRFLADADPDKRAKVIDRLLASPAFATHLTTTWRGWLLPEAATDFGVANSVPGFEAWLRNRIAANTPFDQFVTQLLTAPLGVRGTAGRQPDMLDEDGNTNPLAFYNAKEGKPENLAAATSRVFMGVQLECAQCHDHPFAKWTRDQFWGLAAFYAGVERPMNGALREVFDKRELTIPNADRTVPATFLDDKSPEWQFRKSPRVTLAAWLTSPDNPFFARAAVNRLWGFAFGLGLVDPIDDFHEQNKPSHPELLDDLAKAFVASGFDQKFVLKAIVLSETFQRSSGLTDPAQADVRLFARFPVQGLTPEQLFDSLAVVIGNGLEGPGGMFLQNGGPRRQFAEAFAVTGRKTENPTTIIQALTLMNGGLVGGATTLESSRTLAAVVELPGLSPTERVDSLYLAALGRTPTSDESKRAVRHVERDSENAKARYADVLWALLNGVEFRTNH